MNPRKNIDTLRKMLVKDFFTYISYIHYIFLSHLKYILFYCEIYFIKKVNWKYIIK